MSTELPNSPRADERSQACPAKRTVLTLAVLYLLTATVAFTCGRIEYLNIKAGGRLPRREYRNADPSEGVTPWRVAARRALVKSWFRAHGLEDEDGKPVRPLTAEEQRNLDHILAEAEADGKLLDCVGTFGLLQYPLVFGLFCWSILAVVLAKQPLIRWLCLPATLVAAVCGAFMFYRAYFTSLGL